MSLIPLDENEKVSFRQKDVSMHLDPLSRSSFTSLASQTGRFHNADMLGTALKTTCSKEKREKKRCTYSSLSSTRAADYQCCSYLGKNNHSRCLFFQSASPLTIILYLGINTATVQPDNMQLKTKIIKKLLVSA